MKKSPWFDIVKDGPPVMDGLYEVKISGQIERENCASYFQKGRFGYVGSSWYAMKFAYTYKDWGIGIGSTVTHWRGIVK